MVHLLPLPGTPGFSGSIDRVVDTAVEDARVLADSGFPALMVENFGDVPFFADDVPAETVAALAVAVRAVTTVGVPVGVNVLRNDGIAALGIAAATGARFIRVNVLTGMMITDQGPIVGKAAEIQRQKATLCPEVEVWADVMVKHATPPAGLDVIQATADTVERGLADAIIVSGSGTGSEPDLAEVAKAKNAAPETRLVIGSGARSDNLAKLLEIADSVIVGSDIKEDGDANKRPDKARTDRFIQTARESGLI